MTALDEDALRARLRTAADRARPGPPDRTGLGRRAARRRRRTVAVATGAGAAVLAAAWSLAAALPDAPWVRVTATQPTVAPPPEPAGPVATSGPAAPADREAAARGTYVAVAGGPGWRVWAAAMPGRAQGCAHLQPAAGPVPEPNTAVAANGICDANFGDTTAYDLPDGRRLTYGVAPRATARVVVTYRDGAGARRTATVEPAGRALGLPTVVWVADVPPGERVVRVEAFDAGGRRVGMIEQR